MSLSDGKLAEILARVEETTPGSWDLVDFNEGSNPPTPMWGVANDAYSNPLNYPEDEPAVAIEVGWGCRADAEFISRAREDVTALVTEVKRLKAELAESQIDHERYRDTLADQ